MIEVYTDVGGERYSVADENRQSTIVADIRMAWMWKVSNDYDSNNTNLEKQKRSKTSKICFWCLHILADVKLNNSNVCGASWRYQSDFCLLAYLLWVLNLWFAVTKGISLVHHQDLWDTDELCSTIVFIISTLTIPRLGYRCKKFLCCT